MFGILVGGQKVLVHKICPTPEQFSGALVDIYSIRIPDLTIIDAITGMEGNGPSAGGVRNIGKIIASGDGVAADSVMAAMMGIDSLSVDQIRIAAERTTGQADLSKMDIQGSVEKIPRFKLPVTIARTGFFSGIGNLFFVAGFGSPKLRINKKSCKKCGICMKHCPCGAIILDPYPVLQHKKCTGCFCCFELCEHNSVEVGSVITRLFRKIFGGDC